MSTSPEANPSTDVRAPDADGGASTSFDGFPADQFPVEGPQVPVADPAEVEQSDAVEEPTVAEDRADGVEEDVADHSWPDVTAGPSRTIDAGPDLEIVADATPVPERDGWDGRPGDNVPKPPRPRQDPEPGPGQGSVSDLDAGDDRIEARAGRAGGGGGIAPGPRAVANLLLARIDDGEAAAHLVEYRRAVLWMWRRLVGVSFAYIVVSLAWYLVKLPAALITDATLPTQIQVAGAFHELRIDGLAGATLAGHAGSSLFRFSAGLGVGAVVGLIIGFISGSAPLVRTIIDPVVSLFRMVPGLAAGPLLVIWFGLGEPGLVAVVAFSVCCVTAAISTDGRIALLRRRPLAAGSVAAEPTVDVVFSGLRTVVLIAWTTTLTIETVASSTGLGAMIWFAQGRSDMVLAGILVVGAIGFAIDTSLRATQYLLTNNT